MIVVLLSRFTPGLRLPTYVAAGLLKTNFWRFTVYFLIAAAVWTPLLVGAAALFGSRVALARWSPVLVAAAIVLRNFRVRRALAGFVKRKVQWEFWPAWAAYIPLAP